MLDVLIITDGTFDGADVEGAVSGYFMTGRVELDRYVDDGGPAAHLVIFCTNPGTEKTHGKLKSAIAIGDAARLFVLRTHNSNSISRLHDLGVKDHLLLPADAGKLQATAKAVVNRRVERSWAALGPIREKALKSSLVSFEKSFASVRAGQPLPMEDLQLSSDHICGAAALGGFDNWIEALQQHHNSSFRHSMFVCGTLAFFAQAIGIRGGDLDQLTLGGLIHDIGKSQVPLAVLDKPGKLDEAEWKIMRAHPEHSREILLRENGLDADTIAMAVHHHEKLDGTGYPDGLAAAELNDHVRLTAIADVYSALVEKRSYKGAMTNEAALDLMATFAGHLDLDLVRAFRSFVLDERLAA